ncbi:MAG: formate dehydrogenase [Gammaproteobacteria bacterium]|nr:formate dehydrogenase [Gammaproteobacteria bacterium]MYD81473.1 formate dehydrogenase [Gammaproteobacteria bacterium]
MKARLSDDSVARALDSKSVEVQLRHREINTELVGSFGLHWMEPLLQISLENKEYTFSNVSDSKLAEVLQSLPPDGVPESNSSFIGPISGQKYLKNQQRLVFDRAGNVNPLALPRSETLESILSSEPETLIDAIETSGLRGRGGAGFPAHIKWRTVADTQSDQKYVVCNADEGDSGTFSDRMLMEGDPFKLIEGMVIAGYATGSSRGLIYLRSEYPVALEYLSEAIDIAYSNRWLGNEIFGSRFNFNLEIFVGAGAYICGEETSLLESLEGKRGEIRYKPPVPAIAGLFGKPTLVHNVITLASIPGIFEIGAREYAGLGVGPSTGTMPFQISGNVKRGGLIEIPFGTPVRTLVEEFGEGTLSGRPFRTVQIGGPLGAYLSEKELDTPLTYEHMEEIGAGVGHGGLVVFDDTVDLREQAEYAFEFCEIESCGKCTPCRIGSVRGKETMRQFKDGVDIRTYQLVEDLCDVMEQASLCQMGGMTPIPVRSAMKHFPEDFGRNGF